MSPEDRVLAFIVDYEAAHARVAPLFEAEDGDSLDDPWEHKFNAWATALAEVAERHGTASFALSSSSFSSSPDHSTEGASFTGTLIDGGRARVSSLRENSPRYVEYALDAVDDDWRIAAIHEYFDAPDSPALDPDAAATGRDHASPNTALAPLTDADRPDLSTLFVEHEAVDRDGDAYTVRVVPVGRFRTSGVLAVGDFGYDLGDIGVLQREVEPGVVTADVATAYDRMAALRLTFSDADVAAWRLASTADGAVQGVDYANLAVFDWDAAASLTVREKEGLWERFADASRAPFLLRRDGETEPFGVISPSGWGDGAYPVYWGVDAHGVPVQLVLDFGVLPGARWVDGAN